MKKRKPLPKIVSLFSGAGGLDWGFLKEGFPLPIAFDISAAAVKTHQANFNSSCAIQANLIDLGPAGVLEHVIRKIKPKERIGVIGGPPCQGFSRSNPKSRADDPRNRLPFLYLDIIKLLQANYLVEFVVFENVMGMKDKKHSETYKSLVKGLKNLGFEVTENELCAIDYGVPQKRHRIVLSAVRKGEGYPKVCPRKRKGITTVEEAIANLPEPAFFNRKYPPSSFPSHPNHWTMNPRSPRFKEQAVKISGRSFRRVEWDKPSPTIAYGHREIHVHPNGKRRLSIYEAMLLQGFSRAFILKGNFSEQVEQVSNAVPPPLARSVAAAIKLSLAGK